MVQSSVYKLNATPFVRGLSKLLETIVQKGLRVHFLCKDVHEMRELDNLLWTHASLLFLPHATAEDAMPDLQPILLSCSTDNVNRAEVLLSNDCVPHSVECYRRFVSIYGANQSDLFELQVAAIKSMQIECNVFRETTKGWCKS